MKTRIYITLLLGLILGYGAHGQYRSAAFTATGSQTQQTISLLQDFESDSEISLSITTPIYSFSVTGNIELTDTSNSLVRILLVDEYGTEYLVYEVYPLLTDQWQFDFENMAFETSNMQGVNATKLKIVVLNAKLTLSEYHYDTAPTRSTMQRAKSQQQYVIETLNANLRARDIPWVAGETSISSLSYEEKKQLFGGTVPNLNGFEYYTGGIFVMPGYQPQTEQESVQAQTLSLPAELDWRNKDGKNWMTSVKNQGSCNSCWAFAAIGTLEAYSNIYFHHLVNFDLSEQELVSCSKQNGCGGGSISNAFFYIKNNGVVNESCFPYVGRNDNCANKCAYPSEKVSIERVISNDYYNTMPSQNEIKQWLSISPVALGIRTWNHAMVLCGYKEIQEGTPVYMASNNCHFTPKDDPLIGSTAWLIKNSWGSDWGNSGYGYIVLGRKPDTLYISRIQDWVISKKYFAIEYTSVDWDISTSENKTYFVRLGGILNVSATIDMNNERIIVDDEGELTINGGTLKNVAIEVRKGGKLRIINNGTIKLSNAAALDVQTGATLEITSGSIN